jgi:hypothetical protein
MGPMITPILTTPEVKLKGRGNMVIMVEQLSYLRRGRTGDGRNLGRALKQGHRVQA